MTTASDHLPKSQHPIRVGVFVSIEDADRAVRMLHERGFDQDEITVFCSDRHQQAHYQHDLPDEEVGDPDANVKGGVAGSAIGGVLGGLAATAGLLTLGGLPILVAGGMAGALTGGVVGGLTGLMASRGIEKESADFFDQSVSDGRILVSIEPHDHSDEERLRAASHALRDAGAEPIALLEG